MAGHKRSFAEIRKIITEIADLFSKGFSQKTIISIITAKHGVSERQALRYWKKMVDKKSAELEKLKESFITQFIEHNLERINEASVRYAQERDRAWFYAGHNIERDFFDRMQSIGLIQREPEKLQVGLEGRLVEAVKKARELSN